MTSPVSAEQVVDVDVWTVQVHAEPTPELLTRLCHDLDRHSGLRAIVSHLTPDNPEHIRALTGADGDARLLWAAQRAHMPRPDRRHTMSALTVEDRIERAIDKALPHLRKGRVDAALRVLTRAAKTIEKSVTA